MTWLDDLLSKIRGKASDAPEPAPLPPAPSSPVLPAAPAPVADSSAASVAKPNIPAVPRTTPAAPPGALPPPPLVKTPVPNVVIPAPRLTVDMLMLALGIGAQRATRWIYPLEEAMSQFGIMTREQRAAFLAQCGHESDLLLYTREIWGPTDEQRLYEPMTPKSRALGNTQAGDGYKYRGGGLIQLTGRYNFQRMDWRGYCYWLADGSKHTITQIGVTPPEEALEVPPPVPLNTLKEQKLIELSTAAQAAVVAGFPADVLGTSHMYPCRPEDQQCLQFAVEEGKLPELPEDWRYPLWCEDDKGQGNFVDHAPAQILEVVQAASTHRVACTMKNAALAKKVGEAVTAEEVERINWDTL
jgi:hypothetical protein